MNIIRTILSLAAYFKWEIHQIDVKSFFLNGNLREDIYMQQPPSFINVETSSLVCKLNKSWYEKIDAYFLRNGFKQCIFEINLYVKNFGD